MTSFMSTNEYVLADQSKLISYQPAVDKESFRMKPKKKFSMRRNSTKRKKPDLDHPHDGCCGAWDEEMLEKIAKGQIHPIGPKCSGCYLQAAREGRLIGVIEHLMQGIDLHIVDDKGFTALHLATRGGHINIVMELLNRGAIVNAVTNEEYTSLHIACLVHNSDVAKILVDHGADVNVKTNQSFTPLYIAAQENDMQMAEFLLTKEASQSILSKDGFTPLMIALQQGHDNMVALLLEHDPMAKTGIPALNNTNASTAEVARALTKEAGKLKRGKSFRMRNQQQV